ncbi:MAG: acyl-CoA reductase [Myxococcota bacterium]|jgi:hypothetical protein|nr:acyl-CoA reductase [Myxococcota bacterium]
MSGVHEATALMSAAAIDEAAARICAQSAELRSRGASERLKHLGDLLECFRDPESRARRDLESRLPAATGFTPETLRAGIELGFAPWTADALERLYAAEVAPHGSASQVRSSGAPHTAVLLAGSIPMPSVLSIVLPLAIGSPVLCKPASRDDTTARIVADALGEIDPFLAECVAITPFDAQNDDASSAFFSAPCVSATGSDETIDAIHRWLGPHQRRVLYRHRVSVAVVDLANVTREDVVQLALDIALWDQLGCLSPVVFHLVGGAEGADEDFAAALATELAALETRLPRGAIDPAAAVVIANERADAEMRAALGQPVSLHASEGTHWTVVLEHSAESRPAPLHRFIRLVALPDRVALREALGRLVPHLAGVALVGFRDRREEIVDVCVEFGASRVCEAGRLQAPPIDWKRDNQPLLLGMTSLATVEVATD